MTNIEKENICMAKHHFTFPWLCDYRCGNCYTHLGENIGNIIDNGYKCPKCGYINKGSTSKILLNEYPKIIGEIEKEINNFDINQ